MISASYQYGEDVPLEIERLNDDNVNLVARFSCGNENIDACIRADSVSNKTVSYLYINSDTQEVVAYCSIACAGVVQQVVEDGETEPVPKTLSAIEIDFFAVNTRYRGIPFRKTSAKHETLSAMIFSMCIDDIMEIAQDIVGAQVAVLYSVPSASAFYERNGFEPFHSSMIQDKDPFLEDCIPMYRIL